MFRFLKRLLGRSAPPEEPSKPNATSTPADRPTFGYAPLIASADPVARYPIGDRHAVLLDHIVSAGSVQYQYILVVYAPDGDPCLFVASEVNLDAAAFGGQSHFLGVFPGEGHLNYGDSDDWADRDQFVQRALTIVAEYFPTT